MQFSRIDYPFADPVALGARQYEVDVAIVGAGPVGIALALDLTQRDVSVALIETRKSVSEGSRAILFDRQSMRYFSRLGVAERFMDASHVRRTNTIYYKTREVYQTQYEDDPAEKFPMFSVLQQCWTEQVLLDALVSKPNADIRWETTVTNLVQNQDSAVLHLRTPTGSYQLKASYVIASDGARGPMKELCGTRYESPLKEHISERPFVICDFVMKTDLPKGRRMFIFPPNRPEGIVLLHSQPFDTWRLDYPLADGEDLEHELRPDVIRRRLDDHMEMMGISAEREIVWTTSYRARAALLPNLKVGRVLFAGDAGHLSPIFGGRGLNLGFADCSALGWRLADVVRDRADEHVLDDYSRERRQATLDAFKRVEQSTVFITCATEGTKFMRRAVMELSSTESFTAELFDPHRARRGEVLRLTPPDGSKQSDLLGAALPSCRLADANGTSFFLQDLLGTGYTVVMIGDGEIPMAIPERCTLVRIGGGRGSLNDRHGDAAQRLGHANQGARYVVVRPDMVVAAVFDTNLPPSFFATLSTGKDQ